ncbi:site-specific integrase [Pedobacter nutrimenti]|uniref:Integrase-like protein n=1 Tax=Pedobacter nutrimenti TaxID=1241337 RepID=A0A318U600_9SPHI|nr:site-specific integrase [Pedobacter nutrimenti]PYF68413.1 integrase-like protein [Pedobacter nutrimenti]
MATVSAKVFEHHKKADGTYNVKICVHHNNQRKYIDTVHYVVKKQLTTKMKIKDIFINDLIDEQLKGYRKVISELGEKLNFFNAESLKDYLRDKDADVDFIKFCSEHIAQSEKDGKKGTAHNHRVVRNSLVDYFKRDAVSITEINSNMLLSYERYLRSERTLVRPSGQKNITKQTKSKGLADSGLYNHMRDLRTLFNAARNMYNNEDLGIYRVKHYPFKKYKIGSAPLTKKRNNTLEQITTIRDCVTTPNSRAEMAKELYMLSFYLCGMNAVDFYHLTKGNIRNGRIDYNRSKTVDQRKDDAFISIKIIDEARPLLEKYLEKLSVRYINSNGLNKALAMGMKQLRKITGLEKLTLYWARHSFATIARNSCRMSRDDVAQALNHVDSEHTTTDIYIEKDWRIVDEVQIKVVSLLRRLDAKMLKIKSKTSIKKAA